MNCPKCGGELVEIDNDFFCVYCSHLYKRNKIAGADNLLAERKAHKNIGKSIKLLTVVVTCVLVIISVIIGIVNLVNTATLYELAGEKTPFSETLITILIYFITIPLSLWVISFFAYGFGEMIEQTKKTRENSDLIVKMLSERNESEERKKR